MPFSPSTTWQISIGSSPGKVSVATLPVVWIMASISPSASIPINKFAGASARSLIEHRNARLTVFSVLNNVVSESTICAGGSATSDSSSASPPSSTVWVLSGLPSSPNRWLISRGVNSLPLGSFGLRNNDSPSVIAISVRAGIITKACSSATACCSASSEVKNGITEVPSSFSQCCRSSALSSTICSPSAALPGTQTVASSSALKNAGRWAGSVAAFSSRVSNSFFVSDIVWLLHNELPGGHSSTRAYGFPGRVSAAPPGKAITQLSAG